MVRSYETAWLSELYVKKGQRNFPGFYLSRGALSSLFVAVFLVFTLILMAGLIQYAIPEPGFTHIGDLDSFPPSQEPYLIQDSHPFYLINLGGQLRAYSRRTPSTYGCWIAWDKVETMFIDPCSGETYNLNGIPVKRPLQSNLDQYPVEIKDGQIWVDKTRFLRGMSKQ